MKFAIIITLSLLVAMIGASVLQSGSGYVLIHFGDTRVELNLVLFVLLLVLLMVVMYWLWRFISRVFSAPADVRKWQERRGLVNTQKNLSKGFIALGEGEYRKAQKILTKVADKTTEPLVPLLAAANAAQQQGDTYSSEYLLNKAGETAPAAKQALKLARAEQKLMSGDLQSTQEILDSLGHKFNNNPIYLRLQSSIYLRDKNWGKLIEMLPKLKRKSNLSEEDIKELEYKAYRHRLIGAKDGKEVNSRWKKIPKILRQDKDVSVDFVHKLVETEQHNAAAKHIETLLNKNWNNDLVNLYSQLNISNMAAQIKNLEQWIVERKDNALLHLGLGRLYSKKELWVMAKESLEQSLGIEDSTEARGLLIEANEHIEKHVT